MLYFEFLVATLLTIAYTILGILVTRRFIRRHVRDRHNDIMVPIFLTGGTIYAVFLAFLVVSVWDSHNSAKANVAAEASGLATMYRVSAGMEPVSRDQLRHRIRAYTQDVIFDEWPLQSRNGDTSPAARIEAVDMFQLFGNLNDAARRSDFLIDQTELQLLTETLADRNIRVLGATETVAPIIWIAALVSGGIVMIMVCFLYMETVWLQLTIASLLAVMICLMLSVSYVLSRSFSGPMAISPSPYVHSVFVYDTVDAITGRAAARGD